jgi:signal recognition particle GTPase
VGFRPAPPIEEEEENKEKKRRRKKRRRKRKEVEKRRKEEEKEVKEEEEEEEEEEEKEEEPLDPRSRYTKLLLNATAFPQTFVPGFVALQCRLSVSDVFGIKRNTYYLPPRLPCSDFQLRCPKTKSATSVILQTLAPYCTDNTIRKTQSCLFVSREKRFLY